MGLILEAAEAGGRLEFVTEPALNNVADPITGPVLQAFYGAMGHHESQTKSDRTKAKQAALRARGSFSSGTAPFGLQIEALPDGKKTLVPSPDFPIVQRIYEEVAEGKSLGEVVRGLYADQVPTREGNASWSVGTLGQIIRNPMYRGLVQHKGVTYMTIEALVTAAVWLKANQQLTVRARPPGRGGGRPLAAMLRPVCSCGNPLYRQGRWYRCRPVGNNPLAKRTCSNAILVEELDSQVVGDFETHEGLVIEETVIPGHDWSEEIAAAQLAIKDLDVMADDYDEQHAALVIELRRLKALPVEPSRVEPRFVLNESGVPMTEGDAFKAMTRDEQRAHLRQWTLTVFPRGTEPRWKPFGGSIREMDAAEVAQANLKGIAALQALVGDKFVITAVGTMVDGRFVEASQNASL